MKYQRKTILLYFTVMLQYLVGCHTARIFFLESKNNDFIMTKKDENYAISHIHFKYI